MKKRALSCTALLLAILILITSLAGCGRTDGAAAPEVDDAQVALLEDLSGKKVGVLTGSVNESNAKQYIPGCQLQYFNAIPDMVAALSAGRVDAIVEDESTQRFMLREYTDLTVLTRLCDCSYASAFPKSADGEALCAQMNEFLVKIRDDGTLEAIDQLWFEGKPAEQIVDFSGLTGENGTLTMAICTGIGEPFAYVKDGQYAGYDIDIAVRFCREYGYALEIQDFIFAGLLAAVSAGKCDFGASGITATEERAESVLFSDTTYLSGSVVIVRRGAEESTAASDTIATQYAGKKIGVNTGAIFDRIAKAHIPDCQLEYINATPDIALALDQGKIDGYVLDEPIARLMLTEHTDQYVAARLQDASYGFIFQKDSEASDALRTQVDEFLAKIRDDGTLAEIDNIWFGEDESLKTVDYESLTGENGTLELAVSTDIGAPFVYRQGEGFIGYETDILTRFCREYGYALKIYDFNFAGMLAAVSAGKCDLGASCIEINAERAESMDFSAPDYAGGVVLVTKRDSDAEQIAAIAEEMAGKKIGLITGSVFDQIAAKYLPNSQIEYFNINTDLTLALETGRIDAYLADEPIAKLMTAKYDDQKIYAMLEKSDYAYIYPKGSERSDLLRAQMDEFLTGLKADGTLAEIDSVWFGSNERLKTVDYESLSRENGILDFAISTDVGAPFAYLKNGEYVGYDVDIAVRFCREYGYGIRVIDSNLSGMLAAVSGGRCDFGGSTINVTEERRAAMNFSVPNYSGGVVLVTSEAPEMDVIEVSDPAIFEQLRGYRIGVNTGTLCDEISERLIPNCQVMPFNANTDLALALESWKIDAYMTDEPIARLLTSKYSDHHIFGVATLDKYGFIFPKDSQKGDLLRTQMNGFLKEIKEDGTLRKIDKIWFGSDESLQTVDMSALTGENGTLSFAVSSGVGAPFCYVSNGEYVGYDVDVAVRFCAEYGYDLKIVDSNFSGMIANVSTGKCDFGASCITITEERAESMDFSDSDYDGGVVVVVKGDLNDVNSKSRAPADLTGCRVGVATGTIGGEIAEREIPNVRIEYTNATADLALALKKGKIDAYMTDEPLARMLLKSYPEQQVYCTVSYDSYGYIFRKNDPESDALREQLNEYLLKLKEDGTLEQLDDIWFGDDVSLQTVDMSGLTGENGTLNFAVYSGAGAPFCYVQDGQYVGYDIDIAARFCREYGYGLRIVDSDFSGMMANVTAGNCDFGGSCITITEERAESMNFSDPNYVGGTVIVVKDDFTSGSGGHRTFWQSIQESFERTFLRESRWKLFVGGIGVTILITALAALFGTVIGFLIYLLYRKNYAVPNFIVNVLAEILEKTPVVVILMILYYIIFGKTKLDGVWVSVVGFSLIFACAVTGLLEVAVGAVEHGQMEAALALGYTDTRAFLRVILPQALRHFLPGYRSEIVTLIKGTAIVGYIAVQDLTKISDIIRSRTYEAFFPLIASAVIYFVIAVLLTQLVRRIQFRTDPTRRSANKILKGVRTK